MSQIYFIIHCLHQNIPKIYLKVLVYLLSTCWFNCFPPKKYSTWKYIGYILLPLLVRYNKLWNHRRHPGLPHRYWSSNCFLHIHNWNIILLCVVRLFFPKKALNVKKKKLVQRFTSTGFMRFSPLFRKYNLLPNSYVKQIWMKTCFKSQYASLPLRISIYSIFRFLFWQEVVISVEQLTSLVH